jgi:predicted O-methyltransferase YrrM
MHAHLIAAHTTSPSTSAGLQDVLIASHDYQLPVAHPGGVWAMTEDACKFVGALVRRLKPHRVLEFGSGVSSTVIAAELKRVPGARLISIDHQGHFQAKARRRAEEHDVGDVIQFYRCPIRPAWYHGKLLFFYDIAPQIRAQLGMLDLVLVDGPPGCWGREAAAYVVYPYLKPGALVLLDDANRTGEQRDIGEWSKLYGPAVELASAGPFERGLGVLRKCESGSARRMFSSPDRRRAFFDTLYRVGMNRRRFRDFC